MIRHIAFALSVSVASVAQSQVNLGTTPNVESVSQVTALLDVSPFATITLTQLTFWAGASTAAGTSIGLDIYLVGAPNSFPSAGSYLHLGSTVPQTATGGAQQVTQAIVPAAGFSSLTLVPGNYQLALVASNHTLGLTTATFSALTAADANLWLYARWTTGGLSTTTQGFTGSVHYVLGGTPTSG